MKKLNILGISCYYHDSAAALLIDDNIIAAAQEERFTRDKHTPNFPVHSIKYCLEESGLELNELDAIVFYDKPLLKFERLLETYYAYSPFGVRSFIAAMPVWLNEKLFLKKNLIEGLRNVGKFDKNKIKLLFPEHHLSHAGSAYFSSPYNESAILTIDGVGEWSTASIGHGKNNNIKMLKELHFPHSVGLLYSAFTYYLGFKVNSGEYKLMGLAPYGNPQSNQTKEFVNLIKDKLVDIKEDGSIWLNQKYFNYATGLRMIHDKKWYKLFGIKTRKAESELLEQHHCNLALAIQLVTEEIVIKMAKEAKRLTGSENLCMAGGVALNCVANGKLTELNLFKNIYIQPAAGDAGGALGAAQTAFHIYFNREKKSDGINDLMKGSYLGPDFSVKEIMQMNKKTKSVFNKYLNFDDLKSFISKKISEGNIVGWFQGRMEFGPRALGNRSIIADPRNPGMQKKLNLKIKYREGFRPFAPSVLKEDSKDYFKLDNESPYMLLISPVLESIRKKIPKNYYDLPLMERLYVERSDIQAITHLDFSARLQTVDKKTNSRYWELINDFKKITGIGMLVNTSFNVRGEPIVCNPYDAYRCFMSTEMDILVINDFVYIKNQQPDHENRNKWRVKFKLD